MGVLPALTKVRPIIIAPIGVKRDSALKVDLFEGHYPNKSIMLVTPKAKSATFALPNFLDV